MPEKEYIFVPHKRDALAMSDGTTLVYPGKDAKLWQAKGYPSCLDVGWAFSVPSRDGVPIINRWLFLTGADAGGVRDDFPTSGAFAWFGWLLEPIPEGDPNRHKDWDWSKGEGWRAFPPARLAGQIPSDMANPRLCAKDLFHDAGLLARIWDAEQPPMSPESER